MSGAPSILIVEDNAAMRRMIRAMIADLASPVWECEDGVAAVEFCARRCPDWVLLDIRLPRLDGIAAAGLIRARCTATRLVMVTSFADPEFQAAARRAGASDYVLKDDLWRLRGILSMRE